MLFAAVGEPNRLHHEGAEVALALPSLCAGAHPLSQSQKLKNDFVCLPDAQSSPRPLARRNTELYSSALSRDQAALLYAAAAKVVRLNPTLRRIVRVRETAKELVCEESGTKYKALLASRASGVSWSINKLTRDDDNNVKRDDDRRDVITL
jgi:hypothetical protein